MNRNDLQELARIRIREARVLYQSRQYSGSYYLSGYCIECALKACIARSYPRYFFPEKVKVLNSHTHNLEQLLKIANLERPFLIASNTNPQLKTNWAVVKDWSEISRYEIKTQIEAYDMYHSISQRTNGILTWIRQHW